MEKIRIETVGDVTDEFGEFEPEAAEKTKPPFTVLLAGEDEAQPCRHCGRMPRIHVSHFMDGNERPHTCYIDCRCGECDGKWYPDAHAALKAWNESNLGAKPRKPGARDMRDFVDDALKNFKLDD